MKREIKHFPGQRQSQGGLSKQPSFGFYHNASDADETSLARLGTFQDNLRAPIHRWFKYPAGFSYRLVNTLIDENGLSPGQWLLDPFVGCGTTSVAAKQSGINSYGIEAHRFVWWVAKVKCFWEYDMASLGAAMRRLLLRLMQGNDQEAVSTEEIPALVHKCYSPDNLQKLAFIHVAINRMRCSHEEHDFFQLALTATLRVASKAGTGWPYIAPTKYHEKQERDAIKAFSDQVTSMYNDLCYVNGYGKPRDAKCELLRMDARDIYPIEPESIDLVVTSPPYLNNYDYADRTRLEMYFLGWASTWGEITQQVRDKLIIAATTQIRRSRFTHEPLGEPLRAAAPSVHCELGDKICKLRKLRKEKGGRKSYDLMIAGYFADMLQIFQRVYTVMKKGSKFVLVLGDSAPYGVHIPTEEYLGRLGIGLGFTNYRVQQLRHRGGKWGHNPQRHKVSLRESLLTLTK